MKLLIDRIDQLQNPTVVGLDPTLDYVPAHIQEAAFLRFGQSLRGAASAFLDYNKQLIDAICDIVPAVKPQCAYYEAMGWNGMRCLERTIRYAQEKGMYVIIDGKRNDIGSTMSAYAAAHLGTTEVASQVLTPFGGHCLTVNGYLGSDGVKPLLPYLQADENKSIFVLVKTSNPSSGELQDKLIDGTAVYEHMGRMVEEWGSETALHHGYSQVGAVVGATYPAQLTELRQKLPHTFFLVPGYGAQGGTAKDVAGAFDKAGRGAVVNSSRAILTAWKKHDSPKLFAEQARQAALDMKKDLNGAL